MVSNLWRNGKRLVSLAILAPILIVFQYFHNPQEKDLGLFNAIQSIGSLCATPIAPYLADGLGRKNGIIFGATVAFIGAAIQTATQSLGMFVGARFLVGFGITFAQVASPLLLSEVAYPTHRAPLTSLYNSLWFSGSIVAAWSTFGTFRIGNSWSWRIPSALQGLSSVIQVLFIVSIIAGSLYHPDSLLRSGSFQNPHVG